MGRRLRILAILMVAACGGGHVGNAIDAGQIDANAVDCAGKDVADCRATAGCAADFCTDCNCGQTYMGCRDENAAPAECGALPCPTPTCCESAGDCDVGTRDCFHPGESPGCGAPNTDPGDCTIDDECNAGAGEICEPIPCSTVGAFHCVAGCMTMDDCPIGTECGSTHRCTQLPCDGANPCPDDFNCSADGFCERNTCQFDVDCVGFCVENLCYPGMGICQPIPA